MLEITQGLSRGLLNKVLLTALILVPILSTYGEQALAAPEEGTPVLSLSECIRLAVQDSPTLMISRERNKIARQGVKDAYGGFLPNLSVSRTWSKSERTDYDVEQFDYIPGNQFATYDSAGDSTIWFQQVAVQSGLADQTIDATSKDWGARADLDLFSGFSKFSTLGSAKNSLKAADASRQYTRELVVESVITAYYNLLRYEELALVAVETRDQAAREEHARGRPVAEEILQDLADPEQHALHHDTPSGPLR